MIFKEEFKIKMNDINKNAKIKNKGLFECLENIAARHADSINHGIKDIPNIGTTWVLLCWQLEVIKRPSYGDILEIHTWTRGANRCFSYRDFEIYVNGQKCVVAASKWILIDIKKGKPIKVEEDIVQKYQSEYGKKAFDMEDFDKLIELDEYDLRKDFLIRKSDIDINGHMHNLNYLDIIDEVLDDEEFEKEFNFVRIDYKKEIKIDDKIEVLKKVEEDKYYFLIKNKDTNSVHAIIEMK